MAEDSLRPPRYKDRPAPPLEERLRRTRCSLIRRRRVSPAREAAQLRGFPVTKLAHGAGIYESLTALPSATNGGDDRGMIEHSPERSASVWMP